MNDLRGIKMQSNSVQCGPCDLFAAYRIDARSVRAAGVSAAMLAALNSSFLAQLTISLIVAGGENSSNGVILNGLLKGNVRNLF